MAALFVDRSLLQPQGSNGSAARRYSVLVVDGSERIRSQIGHALRAAGCSVVTAAGGEDALAQLQGSAFDLLVMDLDLCGVDGMDMLRRVVERYPNTQVVIITANGTVETAVDAMKGGAIDFIRKPASENGIQALVERVVDLQHHAGERVAHYTQHLAWGRRSILERHFDAATEHGRRAIACDPTRPEAFNLLGILHDLQGDHHTALIHYRVALDLDPAYGPARANLTHATTWSRDTADGYDYGE